MKFTLPFLCFCLLATLSSAQNDFKTEASLFGSLRARQIGPAVMSGRVSTLAVNPQNSAIIYVGAAGGGVWKTNSAGSVFRPVFDDHTQSIGKIAIAPSDPQTVWVGTGEPWTRNSVSVGTGLYKSTNGGGEWKQMGLEDSERIGDIIVHPTNPDIVYVAVLGHQWDAHETRGIYETTDGGTTWTKTLYVDDHTGGSDLDMDPRNPDVLYATMWSYLRQPWNFSSGYTDGSGVYKSTDGGTTWQKIQKGLPEERLGRMALGVAPSNPDVVYLSVESKTKKNKGMYRSDDAGANWKKVSDDFNTTVRPFYFSNLTVDPKNDSIVMKCGLSAIVSENRGETFRNIDGSVHSDAHDIWIDPQNTKHILVATDGGVYESLDRGYTFKMWMNLPLSQFYHVSVDMEQPYNVYGGLQDNGSWYAPSRKAGGIQNGDWQNTFGGDGFYSFRHPVETHLIFSEYQGGNLVRYDTRTGQAKNIAPYASDKEAKLRWNWNAPITMSAGKGERLYFGAQYLFRSTDLGDSWQRISPDLTTNDPAKQKQSESGGLSIDNSAAENHTTIYTIAESPRSANIVWAGTDDGNVQVTENGGTTWTNVVANVPNLPAHTWVTYVEPSPHDARTAFVTFDGHRTGDGTSYVYKTTDLGKTWTALATPDVKGYALSVRQDLVAPQLLFLGTEFGLYISLDGGASWAPFTNNLPPVGVRDMVVHPRDHALVMATHGRGIIILDDITPLRQIKPEIMTDKLVFLKSEPTVLRDPGAGGTWFGGSGNFAGPNPSSAASIVYYNPKRHTFGKMYVEVWKGGELLKTLPAGKGAGINIVDMPTSMEKPKAAPTENRDALFGSAFGPNFPAGTYDVKVIKGKDTYESTFTLVNDPNAPYTQPERDLQRKTTLQLYAMSETLAYWYHVLDQLEKQLEALPAQPKKIQAQIDTLTNRIGREQERMTFTGGDFYVDSDTKIGEDISTLYRSVSSFPGKPSGSQVQETARLNTNLDKMIVQWQTLLTKEVATLNAALVKEKQQPLTYDTKEDFLADDKE